MPPPTPSHASARAEATEPAEASSALDALDEALTGVRRAMQRPSYRRRLLEGVDQQLELGTVRLLRVVQRSEDHPTIGMAAEQLGVDPSTASRVVERAVGDGYLARRPCSDDRRRSRLELTDRGRSALEVVTARRRAVLAEVTGSWREDRVAELVDLLADLREDFDRLDEGSS